MAKILVVDDDRVNRLLLTRFLESAHHHVLTADSGEAAVRVFGEYRPDIVLLDVVMPGMDGFEATRRIKRMAGARHVPVLLLTALTDEDSLVRGISAGADDFISKPVNRVVLNSRLYASLRTQRLFARLAAQNRELQHHQEQEESEQKLAERLLAGMIRSKALVDPRVRSFSRSFSLFNGDLMLARHTPSGRLRVLLGDFSGHGLHAAIGSMPVAVMFEQLTDDGYDMRAMLEIVNERLKESLPVESFLAACAVEIREDGGSVEIWNCGMPEVLVFNGTGTAPRRVSSDTVPLGIVRWSPGWSGTVLNAEGGERIYLLSDGVLEAIGEGGEEWGLERTSAGLADGPDAIDRMLAARSGFMAGGPENDDVTLVEVRASPPEAGGLSGARGRSRFTYELSWDVLRCLDTGPFIESIVGGLPLEVDDRANVGTILAELVSNAIEHGILGLSPGVKTSIDGFAEFSERREAALRGLKRGRLVVELEVVSEGEAQARVVIRVRDSGEGFELAEVKARPRAVGSGRGLEVVRGLSEQVTIVGQGNVIEAEYCAARPRPAEAPR